MSAEEIRTNQFALAQAARTCKAFQQPALLALWSYQDSFMSLFHLLGPAFLDLGSSFDVRGPIDADHWTTFLNRTRGVRTFVAATDRAICRHPFIRIAQKARGPILVNLHVLWLTMTPQWDVEFSLISFPDLRLIKIDSITEQTASVIESFCTDPQDNPLRFRYLSLCSTDSDPVTSTLLKTITLFASLVSLKISGKFRPVDSDFLSGLVGLKSLAKLDMEYQSDGPLPPELKGFPSLSELILTSGDTASIGNLLKVIQPLEGLSYLYTTLTEEGGEDGLQTIVSALKGRSDVPIENFRFRDVGTQRRRIGDIASSYFSRSAANYFPEEIKGMQCFEIYSSRYYLDTSCQAFIRQAFCPNTLVTLTFPLNLPGPSVGLTELAAIINNHPHLTSLQVYVNPQLEGIHTPDTRPRSQMSLKRLTLGPDVVFSSMKEAIKIAEYIHHLCPLLSSLIGTYGEQEGGWGEVFELIQSYQRTRCTNLNFG